MREPSTQLRETSLTKAARGTAIRSSSGLSGHLTWRLLLSVLALWTAHGCARPPARPSIVLVVVDTLRADRVGAYAPESSAMPLMDRWIERGRVFQNAFATSSWTLPSFASIYTGRYPMEHGAGFKFGGSPLISPLRADAGTLAELLRQADYQTAAVVTNIFLTRKFGLDRGFDEVVDLSTGAREETAAADTVVDTALAWLAEAGREPFLLVVHLFDPHLPYDPPEAVQTASMRSYEGPLELPIDQSRPLRRAKLPLTEADQAFIRAAYDAEVAWADRQLDRLFKALEERGTLGEGLILLTSDHGEELWDHGGFEHGHTLYQELLKVPLVLWGRGIVAGKEERAVSLLDVLPTVIDFVGIEEPAALEGVSLLGGLSSSEERELFAQWNMRGSKLRALIRWPFKAVQVRRQWRTQVFDLARDPAERVDLWREDWEAGSALRDRLRQFSPEKTPARADAVHLDSLTEQRLRALGYVE